MEDGMKKEFQELVQDPQWKARWEANCKADAAHKVMMNCVKGTPEYFQARRAYLELAQAAQEVVP